MENLDEIHDILNDLTCNIEEYIKEDAPAVKEYTPRAKDESKTNFWTLYQRKYPNIRVNYYRRNAEKIKEKSKERYQNDPVYREKMILRAKINYFGDQLVS
eukprot:1144678-Pyramimonas_sp.AAC.1